MADDLSARIAATIRPEVCQAHAYVVADAQNMVKLDAMENPYRLPFAMQQALGQQLGQVAINRYPGPTLPALKAALAEHAELPAGCELMLGNGSDELITLLTLACMRAGANVLAPEPGFVMYQLAAHWQGLSYQGVPLRADFSLDADAMVAAVAQYKPAITFLAYPNNPTANLFDPQAMQRVVDAVAQQGHGWVVIDEAYQPFASDSWMARLARQPHVLVMRTLSKFGLAGVRLGYLCGHAAVIAELDKV
ncbi:MAG: pyridoxal phosphate-dependent aminotransferase, partial [Burkholderiaceae bacterium]